jgi:hypothetical protein
MSEAVSNAEVEDVLSSIRRLVSEERRPVNRPKVDAPTADKLVLTPSLRVSNDAPLVDAYRKPAEPAEPTEWDDGQSASDDDQLGSDFISSDSTAVDEDDTAGASFDGTHDEFEFYHDADEFEDEGLIDDAMSDEVSDSDSLGDADVIEGAVAVDASDDEMRPNSVSSITPRPGMLNLGASELVEGKVEPSSSDRLSAKIAALETAIGRIPGGWDAEEPEVSEFIAPEPLAMAWEDDVDLDATGAPMSTPIKKAVLKPKTMDPEKIADVSPQADADLKDDDTSEMSEAAKGLGGDEYFDEEMLRDLVGEIVRAELQGALGERITRNVRKLVRREIHRALTAQDLE